MTRPGGSPVAGAKAKGAAGRAGGGGGAKRTTEPAPKAGPAPKARPAPTAEPKRKPKAAGPAVADRPVVPAGPTDHEYLAESERPWASLLLVAPLLLAYEAYAFGWLGGPASGAAVRHAAHIRAFLLIRDFFDLLGAAGGHLPAATLVAMLLAAHLVRRDPWRVRPGTLAAMVGESAAWAVPLVAIGWLMARFLPLGAGGGFDRQAFVLCVGAGVYEEMVFRLLGVTLLSLILKDLMGLKRTTAAVAVTVLSGVLFALYHYLGPEESFAWRTFSFRTVAGGYFALLYTLRGFGVTAVSHAAYDIVVVMLLGG